MGEKSAGLTNMILVLIGLVAVAAVVKFGFPEIGASIIEKFKNVINNEGNFVGMIQQFIRK